MVDRLQTPQEQNPLPTPKQLRLPLINLTDAPPSLVAEIVRTEREVTDLCETESESKPLQGDDYQLEYYEDGYPKLPACLDRRKPPKLVVNNPPRDTIKEEAA